MSPEPHGIVRALLRLQEEEGWLPPDRLEDLAGELGVPLHRIESVSTFYTHFRRERPVGAVVEVCRDLSCRLAGAESVCERLRGLAQVRGEGGEGAPPFEVHEVSCLGRCDGAPAAALGDRILDASDDAAVLTAVADEATEAAARPVRRWPTADPYASETLAPFAVLRAVVEAGSRTAP
ncbi:MAG: NAD(P)H-dependent oxidoreductase subunit E, partial [Myxococcota bacterium]